MKHRGRKSAAELAVIAAEPTPIKRNRPSTPPDHLREETKTWWRLITADFRLEPYQFRILQSAAEAWDLYQRANAELAKNGLSYVDPKGMIRANPAAAIARDSRTSFLRALRELKLNVEEPLTEEERTVRNNMRGNSWAAGNQSYYDKMRMQRDDDDAS